jgi:hypothetical protein
MMGSRVTDGKNWQVIITQADGLPLVSSFYPRFSFPAIQSILAPNENSGKNSSLKNSETNYSTYFIRKFLHFFADIRKSHSSIILW